MSDYQYRVVCKSCGSVQRHSDDTKFLDAFFLPSCCPKCGATKSKYLHDGPGWEIQHGRYERSRPFRWLEPSSWLDPYPWQPAS